MSNYALRIPNSLFDYAKRCADEESVSMNQFFVMAIAEKVSALKTAAYFCERAGRADALRARKALERVRDVPASPGDGLVSVPVAREPDAKRGARTKSGATAARKAQARREG